MSRALLDLRLRRITKPTAAANVVQSVRDLNNGKELPKIGWLRRLRHTTAISAQSSLLNGRRSHMAPAVWGGIWGQRQARPRDHCPRHMPHWLSSGGVCSNLFEATLL